MKKLKMIISGFVLAITLYGTSVNVSESHSSEPLPAVGNECVVYFIPPEVGVPLPLGN